MSGLSSPGARAGAGSVRGWVWSEDLLLPPGGSETGLSTLRLKQLHFARRLR
jgi:hypothetical protein